MKVKYEYMGILRRRTFHTWPAPMAVEHASLIFSNESKKMRARFGILSYAQRATPEIYAEEELENGQILWDGNTKGLHTVRDVIFKAPQDEIPLTFHHRHPHRGEVDILINFILEEPITSHVFESIKSFAYAEMAMLNLQLGENLVPTVPFQICNVLQNGERTLENTVFFSGVVRKQLQQTEIKNALDNFGMLLLHEEGGRSLVALELYASHFSEKNTKVRFLLLVMALEALAIPTPKHQVALDFLDKWDEQLEVQLALHSPGTGEYDSLEALKNGLRYQRTNSIRSCVQNLFANLADSHEDAQILRKRARHVYDKRSVLVHQGSLPDIELGDIENDARGLLELVLAEVISTTSGVKANKSFK